MNKTNKVILIMIGIITVLIAILSAFILFTPNSNNKVGEKVETDISEVILDECTDEYENMEEEIIKTNAGLERKNKEEFVLKNYGGKIAIYKMNEQGKEELYEETEISTEYLPEADKKLINDGLKVEGREKLNEIIESFE